MGRSCLPDLDDLGQIGNRREGAGRHTEKRRVIHYCYFTISGSAEGSPFGVAGAGNRARVFPHKDAGNLNEAQKKTLSVESIKLI